MLESLNNLLAVMLPVSVGVERLLTIVKTLVPELAEERQSPRRADGHADRPRRIALHLLALAASWVLCTFVPDARDPVARVPVGSATLPLWLLVLLGSGGSTLWNDVLGVTKALKDTTRARTALRRTPGVDRAVR